MNHNGSAENNSNQTPLPSPIPRPPQMSFVAYIFDCVRLLVWFTGPVKVNIIWTSADIPYSPSVDIQWGDGALETNLPFPVASNGDSKNFQHTFTTDGLMQTTVTVYNDASSVVKVLDVSMCTIIQQEIPTYLYHRRADANYPPGRKAKFITDNSCL